MTAGRRLRDLKPRTSATMVSPSSRSFGRLRARGASTFWTMFQLADQQRPSAKQLSPPGGMRAVPRAWCEMPALSAEGASGCSRAGIRYRARLEPAYGPCSFLGIGVSSIDRRTSPRKESSAAFSGRVSAVKTGMLVAPSVKRRWSGAFGRGLTCSHPLGSRR